MQSACGLFLFEATTTTSVTSSVCKCHTAATQVFNQSHNVCMHDSAFTVSIFLQRNCPEYELLHRRDATDYFLPNLGYALKEPSVDAEEELTEALQWPNSDRRQWSQADNAQVIFSPCKSEFLMVI